VYVGFTYWDKHPWFVCTRPNADDEVVVVNATTWVPDFPDMTCVLEPGGHPDITHKVVMFYGKADIKKVNNFAALLKSRIWRQATDASDGLMLRIRQGACDSEFTPEELRQEVLQCGWRPGTKRA
jgi:hypothetical protein